MLNSKFQILNSFTFAVLACFFIVLPMVSKAAGATLYLSPGTGSFLVGSTFDVSIVLSTGEQPVNTVEIELKFPADKIQLVNPSVGRSIIQIWATQPVFSNKEGKIYFVGGIPSPGIKTSQGIITTMTFRVVAPGSGQMQFLEKNSVLANDGFGTNILREPKGAYFNFNVPPPVGPRISSPTHPDETRWYKDPNPTLMWTRDSGVTGFSYSIDNDPNGFPDTKEDTSSSQVSFENLESGLWYFHLRARADGVWGGTSHYVLQIDTDVSASFQVNVSPGKRTTTRNPILRFFTTDSTSGFDHFELKVVPLKLSSQESTPFFFEVSSPYQLTPLQPGRYTVIVRAYDKAGNWRDEEAQLNIISSFFQFFTSEGIDFIFFFAPWTLLLIILALVVALIIIITAVLWWMHHPHIKGHAKEDYEKLKKVFAPLRSRSRGPRDEEPSEEQISEKSVLPPYGASGFESGFPLDRVLPEAGHKKDETAATETLKTEITEIESIKMPESEEIKPVSGHGAFRFPEKTDTAGAEVFRKDRVFATKKDGQDGYMPKDGLSPIQGVGHEKIIPAVKITDREAMKEIAPGFSRLKEKIQMMFRPKTMEPSLSGETVGDGVKDPLATTEDRPALGSESETAEAIDVSAVEPVESGGTGKEVEPTIDEILEVASQLEAGSWQPSAETLSLASKKEREYPDLPFHSLYSWLLRRKGPTHLPTRGLNGVRPNGRPGGVKN